MAEKICKSDEEWRKLLSPDQYRVTRQRGTELAFTSKHYENKRAGVYRCVCCGQDLFRSTEKFDSGTGWPSFWAPAAEGNVAVTPDERMAMKWGEARCSRCDAHLGHVFPDGPRPTGLRYCINGVALSFHETPDT